MQIRVTLQTRAKQAQNAVHARQRDLVRTQEEVATGRTILRPSDNPVGIRHALLNRSQLVRIDQFLENIELARADMNTGDAFIGDVENRITRAKELAIAMGNDSVGKAARRTAAIELTALIDDTLALANSTFRGRAIFGGEKTVGLPFEVDRSEGEGENGSRKIVFSNFRYTGTNTGLLRRVSQDAPLIETTVSGSEVFFSRVEGGVIQDGVFKTLNDLKTALEENDGEDIRKTISALQTDFERAVAARTALGARSSRLDQTAERLKDFQQEVRTLQSNIEDADLADSISELQRRQIALQATLGASGQIVPLSLLDFLIR